MTTTRTLAESAAILAAAGITSTAGLEIGQFWLCSPDGQTDIDCGVGTMRDGLHAAADAVAQGGDWQGWTVHSVC